MIKLIQQINVYLHVQSNKIIVFEKFFSNCRSRYSYYSRSTSRMRDLRDYQHLPNIILRCFGINHCFWGVIILILGFVELGITANDVEDYWNPTPNRWKTYAYYAPVTIIFTAILVRYKFIRKILKTYFSHFRI